LQGTKKIAETIYSQTDPSIRHLNYQQTEISQLLLGHGSSDKYGKGI
jgi:hypothetical protein